MYDFHAKSRDRQKTGSTKMVNQKTPLVHKRGTIPSYSIDTAEHCQQSPCNRAEDGVPPAMGAMSWYKGRKTIVKMKEPGIAATVYFVHRLQQKPNQRQLVVIYRASLTRI